MARRKSTSFCQVDHLELRRLLSTIYVSGAATGGSNTGTSWTNAYTDLQSALSASAGNDTIEVGQGTYKPTTGTDRTVSFRLQNGVSILGGYAGTGQSNPDERDPATFVTVLSGDIGATNNNSDNTYNVVNATSTDSTASLDGFSITGGNADNGGFNGGGGITAAFGGAAISDCIITGNNASFAGGGLNSFRSTLTLTDCTITGNTAGTSGGGIYGHYTTLNLVNCTITSNTSYSNGGGILANEDTDDTLSGCTITGNSATFNGGGVNNIDSSLTLTNCVLSGNTAHQNGGGINTQNVSSTTLVNCTLTGNTATHYGGASYHQGNAVVTITNSILSGDSATSTFGNEIYSFANTPATITNSDIQGGFAGAGNIDADPMFIDANDNNFRLTIGSPAIDAGLNSAITGTNTDLDGHPRIIDGTVDMGAYEAQPIIYVDAGATGADDGTSWTDAFTTLTAALNYATAGSGQSIDVAEGTYYPTTGTDRAVSFQMESGVDIQGGFASGGSVTANPATNPTILSGDIGTQGTNSDNSYHVVYAGSGTDSTAVLDGFTITGGNADSVIDGYGGGIETGGSPTINNCIITGNAAIGGGGVENSYESPVLTNCIISGNTSTSSGGGLYNYHGSLTLLNCTISGNTAGNQGGAIFNHTSGSEESLILTNCIISGNSASSSGNDLYSHGNSPVTITYSDINPTGIAGTGTVNLDSTDINADPQFIRNVGALGPDDSGDFHLNSTSPAINAGSNAAIAGTSTDLDGKARIFGGTVDMGAFEDFPTALVIFTQPGATVTAGEDTPFHIAVEDPFGGVIGGNNSNVTISFVSSPAGAALGGTSTLSDQSGLVTFNDFFLTTPGSYTLLFSDGSLATATSNTFTVTPGAPASLTITQQPTNTTAGQTISSIQVQAKDQYGNLADGSSINVALATSPSGATLIGTTPVATSGGTATFSNLSLTTAGTYTLSISDGSLPEVTSGSFTISPSAPATLIISQQPVDSIAGQNIPVQVEVEDQYGNLADGTSVTLSVASGPSGATFSGTHTEPTTSGIATFSNLTLDRAGAFTLSASDGNLPALTSQSFTITYAGPQLVFVTEPASIVAGAKIPAFRVSPEDINGNPLLTNKSKITIRSSAGKLLGTSTAAVKNGVAIFKNLSFQKAGSYTFQVTDSGFGSALSNTITVSAAAAAKMVFNPQPSGVTHGTPFNVTVELTDKFGNAVDNGSTVNLVLGSHPKTATSLNLSATVSDGVADFDGITLNAAGNYTLKASDGKAKATSKKFVVS